MKGSLILAALAACTHAATLQTRQTKNISSTGQCGNLPNGIFVCPQGNNCCSQYGYCGSSLSYCGAGCQSEFSDECEPKSSPSPQAAVKTIDPTGKGRCGKHDGKEYGCVGTANCCSKAGICGNSFEYCSVGCQMGFSQGCHLNSKPLAYNRKKNPKATYGKLISKCKIPGTAALTLSTGPHPEFTKRAIEVLAGYGVKATFFVEGLTGTGLITSDAKQSVMKEMKKQGHEIGIMGYEHIVFNTVNQRQLQAQVTHMEDILTNMGVFSPQQCNKLIRPPQTECDAKCLSTLADLGYVVVGGDLDSLDWQNQNDIEKSYKVLSNAVKNYNPATDSYLVLMLDVYGPTVDNLLHFAIQQFLDKKIKLVTVSECLGIN